MSIQPTSYRSWSYVEITQWKKGKGSRSWTYLQVQSRIFTRYSCAHTGAQLPLLCNKTERAGIAPARAQKEQIKRRSRSDNFTLAASLR